MKYLSFCLIQELELIKDFLKKRIEELTKIFYLILNFLFNLNILFNIKFFINFLDLGSKKPYKLRFLKGYNFPSSDLVIWSRELICIRKNFSCCYTSLSSPADDYPITNRNLKTISTLVPVAVVVSSKVTSFEVVLFPQLCSFLRFPLWALIFYTLHIRVFRAALCARLHSVMQY